MSNLYGNPHSTSAPAELSSRRIEQVRDQALRFFNADPEEFDLVFVSNTTAGIKIVMDCFRDLETTSSPTEDGANKKQSPKTDGFWFGYHRDSHTSIVGVREVAGSNHRCFKHDGEVEKWLNDAIDGAEETNSGEGRLGLFAYPGQSNMNGRRLPLTWPGKLRRSPHAAHRNTYSLLDAAALATTAPLDLSDADTAPDFTVVSFYKIFGFPDLGGLIVRRRSGHILQWRKYFGGGTVEMVVCIKDAWHSKKTSSMHEQLEDGTLPFHSIIALGAAIEVHGRLFDSMESVSRHTSYLSKMMYDGLTALQHPNGLPVCRIYKEDTSTYGDSKTQGAAIAFNIQNSKGELVVYTDVERLANSNDIYLRAGGICNPGGIATYLGFAPWQMKRSFSAGHRCGTDAEGTEIVSGQPTGVVRASLGAMSTEGDVKIFLDFIRELFAEKQQLGTPLLHVMPVLRKPKTPQYLIECLRVYPIKGCGGYNIPSGIPWEVGAKGLYLDREWCIVHLDTGTALSRKRYPKMMKIRPSVDLEKGVLIISAPHSEQQPELKISLSWSFLEDGDGYRNNRRHSSSNFRASAAKVCGDPIPAHPYTSPHIVEFFSAAVGARCTLARFSASSTNSTKDLEARHTKAYLRRSYSSNALSSLLSKSNRAPTLGNRTGSVFSADAPQVITRPVLLPSESPISVITRTSLEWHNQQVKATRGKVAQPELFRANVVLAEMSPVETRGRKISPAVTQANVEDNWAFVRIGNMSFEVRLAPPIAGNPLIF
jgi:molybdenum cofactor sulfurtransferase